MVNATFGSEKIFVLTKLLSNKLNSYLHWTLFFFIVLEIKPFRLGPRIRDAEAFWYKKEIKIIYFVPLWLIVFDRKIYLDPNF